jgi:DNA-binding Lrp family transcriptional regulator
MAGVKDKCFLNAVGWKRNLSLRLVKVAGEIMAVLAYVLFKVGSGTEREVCQKLVGFDEVLHADIIFGEYDVVAKIVTEELSALEEFVSEKIRAVPNVLVTSTMIVSREYKGKNNRPKKK